MQSVQRNALGQSLREHNTTVHEGKKRLRPKRKWKKKG